jgi:hypothetical protein
MKFAFNGFVTVVAIGCSGEERSMSTAPTPSVAAAPAPTPKPPLYPPESWTGTSSITSVTPHPCWRDRTGYTSDLVLSVDRAEAMRLFVYWDPTDGIEYVGPLSGQDFSLAGSFNFGNSFSLGCASGRQGVEVILSGRVSGRFSDDGRSISAEEVVSYHLVRTGVRPAAHSRRKAGRPITDMRAALRDFSRCADAHATKVPGTDFVGTEARAVAAPRNVMRACGCDALVFLCVVRIERESFRCSN